jgi:hypothetical protein
MPPGDQRALLPLILGAARVGEARPADAAFLEDRVLVADGRPQRYGSQARWPEGGGALTLEPIADEACVDRRRASVLLGPLADFVKQLGIAYAGPPGQCAR